MDCSARINRVNARSAPPSVLRNPAVINAQQHHGQRPMSTLVERAEAAERCLERRAIRGSFGEWCEHCAR